MNPINLFFAYVSAVALSSVSLATENSAPAPGALPEVALSRLSDRNITPLGQAALGIRPNDWKHGETPNFVYHFFQSFIATPVSVEAEYYYRIISKELEKDTAQWERKCHIFIFEKPEDWVAFQGKAALDPWTGGICAGGELFIQRDPARKWKGNSLGHEVAHLVVHRFFGAGLPLWLKEGHAEYTAARGYAAYHRLRGYRARPGAQAVDPAHFIPLAKLTNALAYPRDTAEVEVFYDESERLVRFLCSANKPGFIVFFDALSKGNQLDNALAKGFGGRFNNLDALEREFKEYATREHGTTLQD
jgi:hypothetical protein